MTKRPLSLLGLVIVISMLVACNKVPKHAQYIPKDVMMVGTINMKNLSQKLIWSAITGSDLFEEMQKNVENE